jgi:hypothetical protein
VPPEWHSWLQHIRGPPAAEDKVMQNLSPPWKEVRAPVPPFSSLFLTGSSGAPAALGREHLRDARRVQDVQHHDAQGERVGAEGRAPAVTAPCIYPAHPILLPSEPRRRTLPAREHVIHDELRDRERGRQPRALDAEERDHRRRAVRRRGRARKRARVVRAEDEVVELAVRRRDELRAEARVVRLQARERHARQVARDFGVHGVELQRVRREVRGPEVRRGLCAGRDVDPFEARPELDVAVPAASVNMRWAVYVGKRTCPR